MSALAIRLAWHAGSSLGASPVPGPLVRNCLRVGSAMDRLGCPDDVNLELMVGRAIAIRAEELTPRQAEDLVRSCERVVSG